MKKRVSLPRPTLPLKIKNPKKGKALKRGEEFKLIDGLARIVILRVLNPKTGKVEIRFEEGKKSVVLPVQELRRFDKIRLPKPLIKLYTHTKPYAFLLYSIQRLATKRRR